MSGDGTHGNVAPNSICPRNWRMPTGGGAGEFAVLNGSMFNGVPSGPDSSSDAARVANWVYTGAFKGVFSGSFNGGFTAGSGADMWSSSAYPGFPSGVLIAGFKSGSVSPVAAAWRNGGSAVRCIISGGTPSAPIAPTVMVDGILATVTAWSDTSITFIAPAHAAGKVSVVVARGSETLTIADGYEYLAGDLVVPGVPNTGRGL
jgi:hypothetical protein